jgi:hypothetical protein
VETNPIRVTELLVGLPEVNVLGVVDGADDEPLSPLGVMGRDRAFCSSFLIWCRSASCRSHRQAACAVMWDQRERSARR